MEIPRMKNVRLLKASPLVWATGFALLAVSMASAQDKLAENSPEHATVAPAATEAPAPAKSAEDTNQPVQDKRILGVLPNYRTADGTVPYQSISWKYKLTIAAKDSFDWPNYIVGGAFAGLYQLEDSHASFGQGIKGYAHYYGTSYSDQVIGNLLTEGFMPILLHEDPRYFRMVHGSPWKRLGYALTRTLVTKTDTGTRRINCSELLGNGIDAAIGNTYYPDERGFGQTMDRMWTQIGTDSISNVMKEFWPDIKRHFKKNHEPVDSAAVAPAQALAATH
jgi:hypothetical protein